MSQTSGVGATVQEAGDVVASHVADESVTSDDDRGGMSAQAEANTHSKRNWEGSRRWWARVDDYASA